MSTEDRLQKMLAHHKGIVLALETTLGLLTGEARAKAASNGHGVLADALALDANRRAKTKTKLAKAEPVKVRRQRMAEYLASFNQTTPQAMGGVGLGSLVRRGYLKKKGQGYIRTAKEYVV
jgi:CRP-like cAMP-binding protein